MTKKLFAIILCLTFIFCSGIVYTSAGSEDNVNGSLTVAYGSDDLSAAAGKLAEYLENVTGTRPRVSAQPADGKNILIKTDPGKAGKGYTIKPENGNIVITGSSLYDTVRGVYGFLEKYCGVRCYASGLTVYSQNTITLPDADGYSYTPFFEFTDTDAASARDTEYSLFNGLNSEEHRNIPAEMGGMIPYISGMCHTLTSQFCDKSIYFDEHPEYFSKRGGKRVSDQLCLTNPDVLKIVSDEVFALLREKHDPAAELQIISLTQADNFNFCRCDKCKAVDKKYGSHAGTMLEFVNAVAREVKAAGYDNVAIDTFAYQYTRSVPDGIVPEDNVIVRLCSIECCFSHPFDDPACPANADFYEDLEGWSKICKRLYIWDYCTDFTNYIGLFPDFGVLQRNIQIFYEHNVKGIYEEGNYTNPPRDTEFNNLRSYMIARLLCDPYCDITAERNAFLAAYYGEGAPYMAQYLDIVTANASEKHLGIYQPMRDVLSLSCNEIKDCDALWENAKNAAQGEYKQRVLDSELCWRWWKMKNRASEFSSLLTFKDEQKKLNAEIDATGVARWEFGGYRAFFVELYQSISAVIYPLVHFVLDYILYRV